MGALRSVRTRLLWAGVLACLAVFATGALWRPPGAAWVYDLGLYNGVFLCGAAVLWRTRRTGSGRRALAAALVVNVAGNVVYTTVVARLDPEPYPSVADAFYLSFYPLLYVAVLGAVRARVPRLRPSMWLDGVVAALGTAAVAVACLLGPALTLAGDGSRAVAANLAYPVADLLLLALLAAAAAVLGLRADRGLLVLAAGLGGYLAADLVYLHAVAHDAYVEGGWLDLLWLCATAALARGATLAPAATVAATPADGRVGWRVLALPVVCSLASSGVLAVGYGDRLPALAAWCAVGCWLAGLVRTAVTFREIRDLRDVRAQARTDELTGLPNRRAMYDGWGGLLSGGVPCSLVLLDLDGFKEINDGLGHAAGDRLLQEVAGRLRTVAGGAAGVARLGGDEFAVLVHGGAAAGEAVARRLRSALEPPCWVDDVRMQVGGSFGIASGPASTVALPELLRCADVAMYEAKRTRAGVVAYSDDLGHGMADRLRTVDELRTALVEGQLLVHLQPLVDPADRRVEAVEALVRWQHPVRGLLSPAQLLPAVEQAGLMGALTETVLDLALAAAAQWWPVREAPVGVNLSAVSVADLELPRKVERALARHGLPPHALTLEIVEDTLMADPARATAVLGQLRELGVEVAIDDYGTGYSSLAYLKDLPADQLKIDRAFTEGLVTDPRVRAIVEHTISLAHVLGLRVVVEGVEDEATLQVLRQLRCDLVQGFHVCRPVPVAALLTRVLEEARERVPA